jgi:hypothetical protein
MLKNNSLIRILDDCLIRPSDCSQSAVQVKYAGGSTDFSRMIINLPEEYQVVNKIKSNKSQFLQHITRAMHHFTGARVVILIDVTRSMTKKGSLTHNGCYPVRGSKTGAGNLGRVCEGDIEPLEHLR